MLEWALFISCIALVACCAGVWYARASFTAARLALGGVAASAPNVLANELKGLTEIVGELVKGLEVLKSDTGTRLDSQDVKLVASRTDVTELLESVEGMLETTETKRRSISQIERRRLLAEEQEAAVTPATPDPFTMTPHQLMALARERRLLD